MRTAIAALATLFLSFSPALADEPLKSVSSFEAGIKDCLLKNKDPAGCLGGAMRGHFSPGNEKLNEVVPQVASILGQWLADDKVFAVHPVKNKRMGDFYDERVYLIEDTTGSIIMLETSFVNTLGKWYLHRFNLSSKPDAMQRVLQIDL